MPIVHRALKCASASGFCALTELFSRNDAAELSAQRRIRRRGDRRGLAADEDQLRDAAARLGEDDFADLAENLTGGSVLREHVDQEAVEAASFGGAHHALRERGADA